MSTQDRDRVRLAARKAGRSMVWLGQQIGVPDRRTFDAQLCRGNLTPLRRQMLAELLGVSVGDLFVEYDPTPEAA